MPKHPRLSIIIPKRNTKAYHRDNTRLKYCLASLSEQTAIDQIEVIVSDLGSDPYYKRKHQEIVKESALGKKCKYVYAAHEGPFNISKARNLGLRMASGDYVMATDVGMIFPPDFCERLLSVLNSDTIVHCLVTDLPEGADLTKPAEAGGTKRPPYCYGGCQAVSRKWAESVHGWDEKFQGWGADDTDFRVRAIQDGKSEVWLEADYYHQFHADSMAKDEYTDRNRARHVLTKARQLPIIRNPITWGNEPSASDQDTAILITTFMRDDALFRCVKLCKKYYPEIPVFVADCGNETPEKARFCDDYEVIRYQAPFDAGVSATRNMGFASMPKQYTYIIILEDDIALIPESDFGMWRRTLNSDKNIVAVGGLLRRTVIGTNDVSDQHYEATLEIKDRTLYVKEIVKPEWQAANGVRFHLTDLILNCFMMRRWVWDEIKWDDRIKTAPEHCQWFVALKQKTKYKVAYCPDVIFEHVKDPFADSEKYKSFRMRNDGFLIFADNWDIDFMWSSWNPRWAIPNPTPLREHSQDKLAVMRENLRTATAILDKHHLRWWLEAGTCLGAIRGGGFIKNDPDIDLGIIAVDAERLDLIKAEFLRTGFVIHKIWEYEGKPVELSFDRADVKVDLFLFFEYAARPDILWHGAFGLNRKTNAYDDFIPHVFTRALFENLKSIDFEGIKAMVPNPAEQYFEERYGPDWRTPDAGYLYWRDCRAIDRGLFKPNRDVYIGGVWDLFHVGHLAMLERCRKLAGGGRLKVGVLTDNAASGYKSRPIIPEAERLAIVGAIRGVDLAIPQNAQDPTADLEAQGIEPDYIIHGSDWDYVPGGEYVRRHGGRAIILPYTPSVSTTDIRKRIIERGLDFEQKPKQAKAASEKIAIGIKTFYREETLWRTLAAIDKHCPFPYRLYIADDGPQSDTKKYKYQKLAAAGHKILTLPFNSGISMGRNAIVKSVQEDYVWMTDDDITLCDGESLKKMRAILEGDATVGVVAAVIRQEQTGDYFGNENYAKGLDFVFPGGNGSGLLKRVPSNHHICRLSEADNAPIYILADQVPNSFMARRDVFDTVTWDNRITVELEHQDFFLAMKRGGKWRAAVALEANAVHLRSIPEQDFIDARRGASPAYFYQKNHLTGVSNQF